MCLVFAEYHIDSQYRDKYMSWVEQMLGRYEGLQIYEGTDQPHLFVEAWQGMEHEAFLAMKRYRNEGEGQGDKDLLLLSDWLAEGKKKIHIWHFQKVI